MAVLEDAGSIQALTGGMGVGLTNAPVGAALTGDMGGLTEASIEQAIVNEALQEAALE